MNGKSFLFIKKIINNKKQFFINDKKQLNQLYKRFLQINKDSKFINIIKQQLKEIEDSGTYKKERIIISPQSSLIYIDQQGNKKEVINFCANNYLGLADNKEIIKKAKETLDSHGHGLSSVRFICGTQDIHKKLEKEIAKFHNKEDSILYASAFDANGGIFEALLGPEDAVLSDELNHASIIDGVRLCKAQKYKYKHLDMEDLKQKLKESYSSSRIRLIVTDGVFSMDGDIAPLDKIVTLAEEFEAIVMIDDCHASGFLGKTGRGSAEYHNVLDKIDIINSTLGKALGGAMGGFTTARQEIIDLLRQKSRPYLFSNTLPPTIVGSTLKVLDIISKDTKLRDKLEENTKRFRSQIKQAGFDILGENHPIVPIMLYDAKLANDFANDMLEKGIYVIGFSYPVVPKGKARIRVQLSAAHSFEQIDKAINAFIEVGKKRNVIKI